MSLKTRIAIKLATPMPPQQQFAFSISMHSRADVSQIIISPARAPLSPYSHSFQLKIHKRKVMYD